MTTTFLYRSKKELSNLTIRVTNKGRRFDAKTKIIVEKNFFEIKDKKFKDVDLINKSKLLGNELKELEVYVIKNIDSVNLDSKYLQKVVNSYYEEENISLEYWINDLIENAHTIPNSKGGVGLSLGRIKSYKKLLTHNENFNLSKETFKKLNDKLILKEYAPSYTNKLLSDYKTVCKYARVNGCNIDFVIEDLKTVRIKTYDEDMDVITLSEKEITKIEKIKGLSKELKNARKWLVLACYTGQRGTALVTKINRTAFVEYKGKLVIKITQTKGNKPVIIPVLPKVEKIYKKGLPYKVSTQKLNKSFKKLGEKAELNDLVIGKISEKVKVNEKYVLRKIKGERPKWMYITTHIGRRSFASNFYGKIPTPLIMKVTGHSKESTFLSYINQSDDSHINAFLDFYE